MCGIVYCKRFDGQPVDKFVRGIYFNQKERGIRGYGFLSVDKMKYNRAKWEQEIFHDMKGIKSSEILFHHRSPTSTKNSEMTAHPIFTDDPVYQYNYYMVHNGIIYNHRELKKKHENDFGIRYSTREIQDGVEVHNDSEALMHELILSIEGRDNKTPKNIEAYGSVAFVLLQMNKSGKPLRLYFGRNSSPLEIVTVDNLLMIASNLGYQEAKEVNKDILYHFDYSDYKFYHQPMKMSTSIEFKTQGRYSGYNDYSEYNYNAEASRPYVDGRMLDIDDDIPTIDEYDEMVRERNGLVADISVAEDKMRDIKDEFEKDDMEQDVLDLRRNLRKVEAAMAKLNKLC